MCLLIKNKKAQFGKNLLGGRIFEEIKQKVGCPAVVSLIAAGGLTGVAKKPTPNHPSGTEVIMVGV
jgi:hypothetical protein